MLAACGRINEELHAETECHEIRKNGNHVNGIGAKVGKMRKSPFGGTRGNRNNFLIVINKL